MRKRTVTTIEMHQVITVKRHAGTSPGWCPVCLQEIEMVPLEGVALLAGVSFQDLCRQVAAGQIHFVESADGTRVCLSSFLNDGSLGDGDLNHDAPIAPSTPSELSDAAQPASSIPLLKE